ncbi:MAG: hypothetical protein HOJ18_03540 [Rhodospirillaceae bacterium]|nr:hypothetical protein [Rhodospirillaceae bacterium]
MSLFPSACLWLFLVLSEECGYLFKKHLGARRYVPVRHMYFARTSLYTGNAYIVCFWGPAGAVFLVLLVAVVGDYLDALISYSVFGLE